MMLGVVVLLLTGVVGGYTQGPCDLPGFSAQTREGEQDLKVLADFAVFLHHRVPNLLKDFALTKVKQSRARKPKSFDSDDEKDLREIQNLLETVNRLSILNYYRPTTTRSTTTTTTTTTTTKPPVGSSGDSVESLVQEVVESMKKMISTVQSSKMSGPRVRAVFQGVLTGIKEALDDAGILTAVPAEDAAWPESPPSILASWPALCKAVWWPYHQHNCRSARCTACSPVLLASSKVCRNIQPRLTANCLDNVMGKGVCNVCTQQFLNNL